MAEVVRHDQSGGGGDGADRAHRGGNGFAFGGEGAEHCRHAAAMRVPVAVEIGEARGGDGLVDRDPILDPRIAAGDGAGEIGELGRPERVVGV